MNPFIFRKDTVWYYCLTGTRGLAGKPWMYIKAGWGCTHPQSLCLQPGSSPGSWPATWCSWGGPARDCQLYTFLDKKELAMVLYALVTSRVDYCNAPLDVRLPRHIHCLTNQGSIMQRLAGIALVPSSCFLWPIQGPDDYLQSLHGHLSLKFLHGL